MIATVSSGGMDVSKPLLYSGHCLLWQLVGNGNKVGGVMSSLGW